MNNYVVYNPLQLAMVKEMEAAYFKNVAQNLQGKVLLLEQEREESQKRMLLLQQMIVNQTIVYTNTIMAYKDKEIARMAEALNALEAKNNVVPVAVEPINNGTAAPAPQLTDATDDQN